MRTPLRPLLVTLLVTLMAGCSVAEVRQPVVEGYQTQRRAPSMPIERTITNFDDALRCMDGLLQDYGASASILVEDLSDKTEKVAAGTTDMFISAMSQMTRRSRAIRTMAFSEDTKNLSSYMLQSGTLQAFQPELIPSYTIRGSISQFDDNLVKKTADAGMTIGVATKNFLGIGGAKSASVSMIALDLTAVRAADFSIVPGVNARNTAAVLQEGKGIDGEANVAKLGVNFMTSFAKSDGKSIAVRNLVELSAIELMGKLNKIPYWKCLGVNIDQPDVAAEVQDWHEGMLGAEKLALYIRRFKAIGLLPEDDAPLDGAALKQAFQRYFSALGLVYDGSLSLPLMRAHFSVDRERLAALLAASAPPPAVVSATTSAPAAAPARRASRPQRRAEAKPTVARPVAHAGVAPIKLAVVPLADAGAAGQVQLVLSSEADGYAYCYLQDETRKVFRIFPNRWQVSGQLQAGRGVRVPAQAGFAINAHPDIEQQALCLVSAAPLGTQLPIALAGADLVEIAGMVDLLQVEAAFKAIGQPIRSSKVAFGGASAPISRGRN